MVSQGDRAISLTLLAPVCYFSAPFDRTILLVTLICTLDRASGRLTTGEMNPRPAPEKPGCASRKEAHEAWSRQRTSA